MQMNCGSFSVAADSRTTKLRSNKCDSSFGIRGLLAVARKTQVGEADPSQCAIRTSTAAGRVTGR